MNDLDTAFVTDDPEMVAAIRERHPSATSLTFRLNGRDDIHCVVDARYQRLSTYKSGPDGVIILGNRAFSQLELQSTFNATPRLESASHTFAKLPGVQWMTFVRNGHVRVQGSPLGLGRVYWTNTAGNRFIASNRARAVALLTKRNVDATELALKIINPVHHPLSNSSCWSDVHGLDPSDYLAVKDQARPRSVAWWSAPHSDNDLQTGAEKTAASIFESVSGSLSGHKTVSCDISGGVDSCSIAAVAHHLGHSPDEDPIAIHGFTSISQDEFNSDRLWAQDFSDSIGFDSHTFSRWNEMPRDYDGLDEMATFSLDEPSIAAIGHRRFTFLTDLAAKKGSSLHFTGYGGDQTFIGTPTHSADALRTDPLWAISQIMTYRAMSRWDLRSCIQQLVSRREYGTWLAHKALTNNRDRHEPLLTWGVPAQIPAWFDRNTVRKMTDRVDDVARTAQPLADLPGRHLEIDLIRQCTRMVRAIADIAAQKSGVLIVAPLIEENVVESALSVRVQERVTPYEYKPVLTSALDWLLPPKIQSRQTKGGEDTDAALGFSGNIESIRRAWDESRLIDLGIVDGDYIRSSLNTSDSHHFDDSALATTISAEMWLRSLE